MMLVKRDYASLLPQLMAALFPSPSDRATAQAMLDEYQYHEHDRVRVGILKASNGDLTKMKALLALANADWRDLLVAAEFYRTFGQDRLLKSEPGTYRQLEEREAREYDDWICNTLSLAS